MAYRQHPFRLAPGQDGAFAVMFVPLLIVVTGFCALAIDMGRLYNRKVDVHGIAKAAALAAARELNGTPAGIAAAKTAAGNVVQNLRYNNFFGGTSIAWNDDALSFSTAPARSGTWVPSAGLGAASPQGQVADLFYARVDTAGLDAALRSVETVFIRVLASDLAELDITDVAIAGKTSVKVTPISVCAMSPDAASARPATTPSGSSVSELVQFGFRRGVSYDLMQLNPNGVNPLRYLVNPVSEPGVTGPAFSAAAVAPFVCSGSMWVKRLTGGTIRVSELPASSPLADLRTALNTRFDLFTGTPCTPSGAAPDFNVKSYAYDQAGVVKWMSPGTGSVAAASTTVRGKLETVADLPAAPATPGSYGLLWAYAKAARAPSPLTAPEPGNGYTPFAAGDWPTIYPSGPTSSTYPSSPPVPYLASSTVNGYFQAASVANRPMAAAHRRVLHIPLLACTSGAPAGTNATATVAGIGKFFMTVPATDDSLVAEFAGLLSPQSTTGHVELFP